MSSSEAPVDSSTASIINASSIMANSIAKIVVDTPKHDEEVSPIFLQTQAAKG